MINIYHSIYRSIINVYLPTHFNLLTYHYLPISSYLPTYVYLPPTQSVYFVIRILNTLDAFLPLHLGIKHTKKLIHFLWGAFNYIKLPLFFLNCHSLFSFIFSRVNFSVVQYKNLPMTGFELQTWGLGSYWFTSWSITTSFKSKHFYHIYQWSTLFFYLFTTYFMHIKFTACIIQLLLSTQLNVPHLLNLKCQTVSRQKCTKRQKNLQSLLLSAKSR